eukprot:766551-Hanusia_phi.AAC.6
MDSAPEMGKPAKLALVDYYSKVEVRGGGVGRQEEEGRKVRGKEEEEKVAESRGSGGGEENWLRDDKDGRQFGIRWASSTRSTSTRRGDDVRV